MCITYTQSFSGTELFYVPLGAAGCDVPSVVLLQHASVCIMLMACLQQQGQGVVGTPLLYIILLLLCCGAQRPVDALHTVRMAMLLLVLAVTSTAAN
jgi:hypothetical protein